MRKKFPDHIFKAYDIRGIYPDELDEALAYKIGRGFTSFLQDETDKKNNTGNNVADNMPSPPYVVRQHQVTDIGNKRYEESEKKRHG